MLLLYKRKLLLTLNRDGSFTVYIHIINDFHSKMIFNKKKYTRSVWIVTLSSFELLKGGQTLKQTTCAWFRCDLELSEQPLKSPVMFVYFQIFMQANNRTTRGLSILFRKDYVIHIDDFFILILSIWQECVVSL